MGYLVAGLAAALLGAIQLLNRLKSRPTRASSLWWVGYLSLEILFGALAYRALTELIEQEWVDGLWGWLAAGTGVAGVLRARFTELRTPDGNTTPVGPAYFYELLRDFFEERIDNIGATEQADWITGNLVPALSSVTPDKIGQVLIAYARSAGRLNDREREEVTTFVKETVAETTTADDKKREALIYGALDLGGWRLLVRLQLRRWK